MIYVIKVALLYYTCTCKRSFRQFVYCVESGIKMGVPFQFTRNNTSTLCLLAKAGTGGAREQVKWEVWNSTVPVLYLILPSEKKSEKNVELY